MIRYEPPIAPDGFDEDVTPKRLDIASRIDAATGRVHTSLVSKDFDRTRWSKHKDAFNIAQHNKCAWCERKYTGYGSVEHILPKTSVTVLGQPGEEQATLKVKGRTTASMVRPGYWWLAYSWENWCFACTHCNSWWKVSHLVVVPSISNDDPPRPGRHEVVQLLHPFRDDPRQHLRVDRFGVIQPLTDRGRGTLSTLGLNRKSLLQSRQEAYADAALVVRRNGSLDEIRAQLRPSRPFALARYWGVRDVLEPAVDQ